MDMYEELQKRIEEVKELREQIQIRIQRSSRTSRRNMMPHGTG